jgi:hypothetical protein
MQRSIILTSFALCALVGFGSSAVAQNAGPVTLCVVVDGDEPAGGWDAATLSAALASDGASLTIVDGQDCAEAATEPSPEPTDGASASSFEPIRLKGRGDKVARFDTPEEAAALAEFRYDGKSNFIVTSVAEDGSRNALLVNEIGRYRGTVLFDTSEHSVAFRVETTGPWAATVKPVSAARRWDASERLTGEGDDVVLITPPTSGLKTSRLRSRGESNLIVLVYTLSGGRELLVNEIGDYDGEVLLPADSFLMTVEAHGSRWSASPPE